MRMWTNILVSLSLVAAALATGCSSGQCTDNCARAGLRDEGVTDPTEGQIQAWKADCNDDADAVADAADEASCKGQYSNLDKCLNNLSACFDTDACSTERDALEACIATFCATNAENGICS